MGALVTVGIVLTLLGVVGLIWCIVIALRARRSGLPDDEIRARLQKVVALNLGALLLSALGLMAVAVGLILR